MTAPPPPVGFRKQSTAAPAPPAGFQRQAPSIWQQLFDVKNAKTGESYIYGNTPPPAPYEDLQQTVGDTVSRGYLDKLRGPEAQAKTAAARQRMPDWVEVPTDIGAAVAGMPYRIGGMGAGALFGGLEGAASSYGHQQGWVPDPWEIGKDAATGAALGAGGAQVGKWLGKGWSALTGNRIANPQAGAPTRLGRVGEAAEPMALGGKKSAQKFPQIAATEWALSHLGVPPGVTTGAATAANWLGKTRLGQQPATMLDPRASEAARDAFAKMLIAAGNRP